MPPARPHQKKKEERFLRDTKSTCFLCLHPVPLIGSPSTVSLIGGTSDEDAGVGAPLEENRQEREKRENFSFRRIFKLLQLDPGKLLQAKLTGGPSLPSNFLKAGLSVMLCDRCHQVSRQLSSLFREWELLQMQLDQAVQNFSEILGNSQKDPNLRTHLRKHLLDPLQLLQGSLAEIIRQETLTRCVKHLQRSSPRVSLPRTETKTSGSITTSAPVVPQPQKGEPTAVDQILGNIPHKVKDEDLLLCGLCPSTSSSVTEMFTEEDLLKKHVFAHHPDFIFASYKNPECGEGTFRELCDNLLQGELEASMGDKLGAKGEGIFKCEHCPGSFSDQGSMHTHLVEDHYAIYAMKLEKLQHRRGVKSLDSAMVSPSKIGTFPVGAPDVTPQAPRKYNSPKWRRQKGLTLKSAPVPPSPSKDAMSPSSPRYAAPPFKPRRCKRCGKALISGADALRHKRLSCRPRSSPTFNCPKCGAQYLHKRNLQRHVRLTCPYRPKTDVPPTTPLENAKAAPSKKKRDDTPSNKKPPPPPPPLQFPFKCSICRGQYPQLTDLKAHVATFHQRIRLGSSGFCHCGVFYVDLREHINRRSCSTPGWWYSSAGPGHSNFHCRLCGTNLVGQANHNVTRHRKYFCLYRMFDAQATPPPLGGSSPQKEGSFAEFQCQGCLKKFTLFPDLQAHIASAHPEVRVVEERRKGGRGGICECGVYYSDIARHVGSKVCATHRSPPAPPRPVEEPAAAKATRRKDPAGGTTPAGKFACEFCGHPITTASELVRHQRGKCAAARIFSN